MKTSVKVRWAEGGVHDQQADLTSVKVRWAEGGVHDQQADLTSVKVRWAEGGGVFMTSKPT